MDTADIVVTREDRSAVAFYLHGDEWPVSEAFFKWVETGESTALLHRERKLAPAFARHRVEAVRAFCEAHGFCEHGERSRGADSPGVRTSCQHDRTLEIAPGLLWCQDCGGHGPRGKKDRAYLWNLPRSASTQASSHDAPPHDPQPR